jgi:uncharacterized protein YbjT (DUF2867 family)
MPKTFVVAGVTGRVGSVVARELLSRGHRVRAVLRREADPGRLPPPIQRRRASLDDPGALARALEGADGLFTLLPENVAPDDFHGHRRRMAEAIAGAVHEAGVPRVVMLSSLAAGVAAGNGPVRGLHHMENVLRATRATVIAVRSTYFQDNVVTLAPLARATGSYPSFLPSLDAPLPTAATRDVGRFAAACLEEQGARGEAVDILGPAYSNRQMAQALGAVLGRSVRVVEIPPERHVEALVEGGLPRAVAEVYAEMFAGMAAGIMSPRGDRRVEVTTTLEQTLQESVAREGAA